MKPCPICDSTDIYPFFKMENVPIFSNLLWNTRESAVASPQGDIHLVFCNNCSLIYNQAFDPQKIVYHNKPYENPLHYSPYFKEYANQLANSLIHTYDLNQKNIIEIGCGDGYFLNLLCSDHNNQCFGFDPGFYSKPFVNERLQHIQDHYSLEYAYIQPHLIIARHTLEHIDKPREFLGALRQPSIQNQPVFYFFEVPNAKYMMDQFSVWDIIYEHFSYYSMSSLEYLFYTENLKVTQIYETYGNQFLCIEASTEPKSNGLSSGFSLSLQEMDKKVLLFEKNIQDKLTQWKQIFQKMNGNPQKNIVWGSGAKGVTLLNLMKNDLPAGYIVDINPTKQGKFVAGTGHEIISPEKLRDIHPETIIITNPVYKEEIKTSLDHLGVKADIFYV